MARALAGGAEHSGDRLEVLVLLGAELAGGAAVGLDPARPSAARLDRHLTRAGRAEVLSKLGRSRRVALPDRQHAAEHALRQAHARAGQQSAAVARELEQRHVLDAELARHRSRRHIEQLLRRGPLEREPAQLGQCGLPARAGRQLLAVAVGTTPQHPCARR